MSSWGSPTNATPGVPGPGPMPAQTPPGHGRPRRGDGSWVGGVILIAIGLAFLVGQLIPNGGRYVVVIVGGAFLMSALATREYGLLVPGGIVTGVGIGILLEASEAGRGSSGLFLLSLGLGFISIWVVGSLLRMPENHPWPFIPGLILASLGAVAFAGTRYADAARIGWPVILIVLGLVVVVRAAGRRSGA